MIIPNVEIEGVKQFYVNNIRNLKFCHININSVRHKFGPIQDVLNNNMVDVMLIQETKLDDSFPLAQFNVDGYTLYREDHKSNSCGIMAHIRNDIPQRRLKDFEIKTNELGRYESMAIEINLNREKWLIISVYKQPQVSNDMFVNCIEKTINLCRQYNNFIIIGDMNINMLGEGNVLECVLHTQGLTNLVKEPTCFKSKNPTLLDLVVTNVPKRFQNVTCFDSGLSDFHHMICFASKIKVQTKQKRSIIYRSYKQFKKEEYLRDIESAPFHVGEIFDTVDDSYWLCSELLRQIIDQHAPIKTRVVKVDQLPYMNSELRKAINVKNMLRRKWDKCKTQLNWDKYRKQRNLVTRKRKQSVQKYVTEKCVTSNGQDFWKTVKPLMSNKCKSSSSGITLIENGDVINDPVIVGNVFNQFYIDITKDIGEPDGIHMSDDINHIINKHVNHESVEYIKHHICQDQTFHFQPVSESDVSKKLKALNAKKATGCDKIPPKLIKMGEQKLAKPITSLINMSIKQSIFPESLKCAQVTPIFKKNDMLNKKNYRPVSVLPCISKIFEAILIDQMSFYLESMLSNHLSGFRKGHSCQNVLNRFVESCKLNLDNGDVFGAILTDLSKAFDCLPHCLLISKLHAYGVNKESCELIASYFRSRKQRVNIGKDKSEWLCLSKGAPQGSLFGPFAYNIFTNDLLILISKMNLSEIFNYADDNTVACHNKDVDDVKNGLQNVCGVMLKWFKENYMQANPDKFQFILFNPGHASPPEIKVNIDGVIITIERSVTLLGVHIDYKLDFSDHINELCKRAGRKLNALGRLSKTLDTNAKMCLFQTFILSHFNYCPVVWHFTKLENMKKIEKIQERALRYVFNDFVSSYSDLLKKASRPLLYVQRLRSIMVEVYKIVNGQSPQYLHNLFTIKEQEYCMRNDIQVCQPIYRTNTYGNNSFRYQGAKLWNLLDSNIKGIENLKQFKSELFKWDGPKCNCANCHFCRLKVM